MLIRVTLATSYSFAAKTRLDVLRRSQPPEDLGTCQPFVWAPLSICAGRGKMDAYWYCP